LSTLAELDTGSNNIKLNIKREFFPEIKSKNAREIAKLLEKLKQKVQTKAQRIRKYEKENIKYFLNEMFKEDTKQFYRYMGAKTIDIKDHSHM